MASGTLLLEGLDESDLEWFFSVAREEHVAPGTCLIREGAPTEKIYIVLQGFLTVSVKSMGDRPIAALGQGQIVGEMSFLERNLAFASVTATEPASVLTVSFSELDARIASDSSFGNRFHLALGRVILQRLRRAQRNAESIAFSAATQHLQPGVPLTNCWNNLSESTAEFKALLERSAMACGGEALSEEAKEHVEKAFTAYSALLHDQLGPDCSENELVRDEFGRNVRAELVPLLKSSSLLDRIITRPRGIAGDYRVLQSIYDGIVGGVKGIGPALDRAFLAEPICDAMRWRAEHITEHLVAAGKANPKRETLVTSLASGPADEIFDAYTKIKSPGDLRTTLIDLDNEAIHYVNAKRERTFLENHIVAINENVLYLATGKSKVALPPQDVVYSIGLIDHQDDSTVVSLLNFIHGILKPGGSVLLANIQTGNLSRELLEHVLDWRLVHRTRDDLNRLFRKSRFGTPCGRFRTDPKGIYLYAESTK